jgi:DGQHR domain-containing protein
VKFENVLKIIQWGYGAGASKVSQYIFAAPAEIIASKSEVYRRQPDRKDGYQRALSKTRLSGGKLGVPRYLLHQMGIFPTSILVNIRREDAELQFIEKGKLAEYVAFGDLIVPDNATWYILDGQHRVEGLKIAMREQSELSKYPLIITMTNESVFYEVLIFYIVNSRAKSVPTDLAYRILQRMLYDTRAPAWVELELMGRTERRKAVAATIVDFLNIKENSPFKDRICEVGEPFKDGQHITTDGTLTRYVSEILKEKIFQDMYDEDLANLLIDYWNAVKSLYPNCFKNHKNYVLLDTLGLSSLSRLFPVIFGYCSKDGNISMENMKKYLGYLLYETQDHKDPDFRMPITEKWWHKTDSPAGGVIHGTGEGHYSWITQMLAEKIKLAIRQEKGHT